MKKNVLLTVLVLMIIIDCNAQNQYKVIAAGFYNCENFFDTVHDPNKKDEDFTPGGSYHYTSEIYKQKLHNIATVIERMGTDITPDGPAIIGLAEIENGQVLKDLVEQRELKDRNYKFSWFYTPDERGISTALLYNPKYLKVISEAPVHVPTETLPQKRPTRDILYVCGVLAGDTVHILVNHWPSKFGGEAGSAPGRKLAATVEKRIVDSLFKINPNVKILILGDFNENPDEAEISEILDVKSKPAKTGLTDLYDPWIDLYKKGAGTESYQGNWNMIDQVILSGAWLSNNNNKWKYYKSEIFNWEFLVYSLGHNKGLPHRSFTQSHNWDNGYSDHFPVLVYFVEKN